ncbi:PadR family transcriptional regulator [Microbacterium excoecariae]|uniref:PadR family transcriptional regulator n=1 Tax=Microbacterium excoecariae TaxID=2715210 RepID=UPI00197B3F12|nr:PadR family transcriptional regulator [Microbacterium excoecariae]NHI16715.1 PadR family transcriptional regulator [Microbacterium excoecariae]
MKLEHLLLGVLATKASTGYDLKKYLDEHGRFLRSNTQMSQVYRSLGRMESDGWVRHSIEERPGATDAKRYRLTPEGGTVLMDWLTSAYQPPSRFENPELMARLSLAGFLRRMDVLRLLDTELEVRTAEVARFRHRDRRIEMDPDLPFDPELHTTVSEWAHETGSGAMDAHILAVARLRDAIADAPDHPPLIPIIAAEGN